MMNFYSAKINIRLVSRVFILLSTLPAHLYGLYVLLGGTPDYIELSGAFCVTLFLGYLAGYTKGIADERSKTNPLL